MAIIWADSFDHYGTGSVGLDNMRAGAWEALSGGVNLSSVQARTGALSLNIGASINASREARRVIPGASNYLIGVGYGLYFVGIPTSGTSSAPPGMVLRNSVNASFSFSYMEDGSVVVSKGDYSSGDHVGATDAGVLQAGMFQHVECAVFIDPIAGWVEIRVDGVRVYRLEDADTGTRPITQVTFITPSGTGQNRSHFIDDVFCWDDKTDVNNSFIGPASIETVFTTGDVPGGDWQTVGAATGSAAISEVPQDGDTSYVSAEEPGEAIEFTLPELPPEVVALAGIYVPAMARIEDVGIGRLRTSLVYDGHTEHGQEVPLTAMYAYRRGGVFQKNPATGDVWTKEQFKDATLRLEKTM